MTGDRMKFTTTTVRLGLRRVRVTEPNPRQYGHLGLEMATTMAYARKERTDVYFVRPATSLGLGLFELESPDVRVLRPARLAREIFRAAVAWRRLRDRLDRWRALKKEEIQREMVREATRYVMNPGMPPAVRERVRRIRRRLRTNLEQMARDRRLGPPYYERRLLREPVPVRLHAAAEAEAVRQARAHGIDEHARLVCIHAREGGYKRGQEIHETKPEVGRDDRARNAKIESYLEAVDDIVREGYTVVRLGDPTMAPLRHPGVIDLATSPARTNLLEVWCLLRCAFVMAGESAFVNLVYMTNTPILLVNATEPISAYSIRAPGLFLTKTVIDRRDGRRLTPLDMLSREYHRQLRDTRRYSYVDNTPEEIRDVTREMLAWVRGTWRESEEQRRYHEAIMAAAARLRRFSAYVRKWGLHEEFLGDGRIAQVSVASVMPSDAAAALAQDVAR